MRDAGARDVEPDPQHRFLEKLAVFAFRDGLRVRADQFHVVPHQGAVAIQFHGNIERGLASHRRQDRVRFFPRENRFHDFGRDRLDVSPVGEFRVGHDRGRVRIHEHDLVAFLAQRLAGLDAGIVELAALPDHDRARTNQQNFVELVIPRHLGERTIDEFARRSRAKRGDLRV